MRLTLRTLLAYLDDILPEEDSKAIGEKLEESEMASALVHRIRSSTRRMRLSAPPVDGRGIGSDANSVAEYLDNTLSPERIAEFERVCLESDVHLAEAAACHQILTLVLAQPAEIPDELRARIHDLVEGDRTPPLPEAPPVVAGVADSADLPSDPAGEPQAAEVRTREVPEYLRRRPWNWKAGALVVVLTLVLVGVGLRAMGPFDGEHPIIGGLFSSEVADNDSSTGEGEPDDVDESDPAREEGELPNDSSSDDDVDDESGAGGSSVGGASDDGTASGDTLDGDSTGSGTGESVGTSDSSTSPNDDAGTVNSGMPDDTEPVAGGGAMVGEAGDGDAGDTGRGDAGPGGGVATDGESEAAMPTEVGRFLASDRPQVLAKRSDDDTQWTRLAPRTVLQLDERFLVLPTYRPQVALTSGVQLTAVGPSEFSLGRSGQQSVVGMPFGRFVLDTAGIAGTSVRLDVAGRSGLVTFTTPEASLAVAVRNALPLGSDPRTTSRVLQLELVASSGSVKWEEPGKDPQTISEGSGVWIRGNETRVMETAAPPTWMVGSDLRGIDVRASLELEPLLDMERPLRVTLLEQTDARQVEVSALAIQASALLGDYDPAVVSLGQERFYSYWRFHLATLRERVAHGVTEAEEIEAAMKRYREEDADERFPVLWGYTQEQLSDGAAASLVKMLESDFIDRRVLAIETLRRITGGKTHLYRPEKLPIQQKKPIQDWRNSLERNEIRYLE